MSVRQNVPVQNVPALPVVPITDVSFYDTMKKAGKKLKKKVRSAADAMKKTLPTKATQYEKPFVPGCCSDTLCSFHMANER